MDEYKEYIYRSLPKCRITSPGDLSRQHNLRKQLQCKSFHWFMTEIAFDLMKMYPLPKKVSFAVGEIRSIGVDGAKVNSRSLAKLQFCCKTNKGNNCTQNFEYFLEEDIRIFKKSLCLEVSDAKHNRPVIFYSCHGQRGNQHWQLRPVYSNKENPSLGFSGGIMQPTHNYDNIKHSFSHQLLKVFTPLCSILTELGIQQNSTMRSFDHSKQSANNCLQSLLNYSTSYNSYDHKHRNTAF
ncbi:hypothetical protein MN116_001086 [Schistosoma mekongi]|uniref:Ricin B lectin domain-containing protein n=1 Tax=Schistosoma mekongi TaxID=38744 RepID=A0AAE1ZKJ8_SCHME|nr:hypothetical protein MN116_001086 [Schistosoma mekongi]